MVWELGIVLCIFLISDYEGLFIESWSGSSGYSTEMLTEGAQSWRVEDKLPDHDEIE